MAYPEYPIIARWLFSCSQPLSDFSSVIAWWTLLYSTFNIFTDKSWWKMEFQYSSASPIQSTPFHLTTSKYQFNLNQAESSSASANSLNDGLQTCLITASRWPSEYTWFWPPHVFSDLINHGFYNFPLNGLWSRLLMAFKWISESTPSRLPRSSQTLCSLSFIVHLRVYSMLGSKCISKVAGSQPPSISLSPLNHSVVK